MKNKLQGLVQIFEGADEKSKVEREKKEMVVDTMLEECLGHAPPLRVRGAKTIQAQWLGGWTTPHMLPKQQEGCPYISACYTRTKSFSQYYLIYINYNNTFEHHKKS